MDDDIRKLFLKVGDIVKMNATFLGEPKGVLAYVYETYYLGSKYADVSIITVNGIDIGGFSQEEIFNYLEFVRESGIKYEFKNVIQLDRDFETKIKPAFDGTR